MTEGTKKRLNWNWNWKTAGIVIALGLVVVFVLQNMNVVQVQFLFWRIEAPRVMIYLLIFFLGGAAGWVGRSMYIKRGNKKNIGNRAT